MANICAILLALNAVAESVVATLAWLNPAFAWLNPALAVFAVFKINALFNDTEIVLAKLYASCAKMFAEFALE